MNGPTLFDAAELQRDLALSAVADNSPIGWQESALTFVESYLREHRELFVDDLWSAGLSEPRDMRAVGPLLRKAARAGLMRRTDRSRPSVRSHLAHKPIWESLIYQGPKW